MPDDLLIGASFSDIMDATPTDETANADSTPNEAVTPEAAAATDGGATPEPETLGILKPEEEAPKGEDKPDLSLDADLDKHPVLKAKWEAYVARKEKGIDKFIQDHKAQVTELEGYQQQWQPLVDFYNQFEDPSTVDGAFELMCRKLAETYRRPFGGFTADGTVAQVAQAATGDVEPKSKYGFEFASDDKVADVVLARLEQMFDKRLGPIAQRYEADTKAAELQGKAAEAVPALKAQYEVSSDPWVTPEKVAAAMQKYPGLNPQDAFAAAYVKDIATYTVKHSASSKQTVRNMPMGGSGGTTRNDLSPGASFADILVHEGTL